MTGTQLAALIRYKTGTTSTTFSDANMLVLVNLMKDEISAQIAEAKPEAFNVVENDDLVGDQRLYAYKTGLMNHLVRLELKFSSSGDYVLADPVKLSQVRIALQESIIINYYDNLEPAYFVRGKHIYILSGTISAVTSGIQWVYQIFPSDLANMTGSADLSVDTSATALGFPREFNELLARRVSIEFKGRPGSRLKLNEKELAYPIDLQDAIDKFAIPNIDEQIIGALPTGEDRGDDDGYEL